jgi:DNA-binding response OmpR family regulator
MSRILIIDDDPQLGRSLQRVLEHAGHTCYLSSDPRTAAEAAPDFKPDAILIELQPEYAPVLPKLRDALGPVPFVFMAGHHEEFAKLGALVGAADDWLAKPAAPQEFIVRLDTALRRAQSGDN